MRQTHPRGNSRDTSTRGLDLRVTVLENSHPARTYLIGEKNIFILEALVAGIFIMVELLIELATTESTSLRKWPKLSE